MAPASIVIRLTDRLVCGYDSYGFCLDENGGHSCPKVVDGILHGEKPEDADYPGGEFFLGGEIVKHMDENSQKTLRVRGVTLDRSPQRLLELVGERAFPKTA